MSTIIVLTDFSPLASNASDYAATLAQKTGCEIDLVHVYELPMPLNTGTPDVMPLYLTADQVKKSSEENMDKTRVAFQEKYPGIPVNSICRAGTSIVLEIDEITKDKHVFAVVAGVHEVHGIESLLGSTSNSLIKSSKHTVIAVPASYKTYSFNKAIIATDLAPIHARGKKLLVDFLQKLAATIEIVYVKTGRSENETPLENIFSDLEMFKPSYKTIESDDVSVALYQHIQQTNTDMLIVLSYHHSLFENLFSKKHMRDILDHANVPVVAIPGAGD
jgi:nucleotide-binding universal stress UspA family protein